MFVECFLSRKKPSPEVEERREQYHDSFVGTLTDRDIRDYVRRKQLIREHYDDNRVKQACYELRASNIYYCPVESDKRKLADPNGVILLRPNQVVVIITEESLDIPSDILGRVLTRGTLFSLGINAVNTYADPGFTGRLGIVFQNRSTKYIKIPVGDPIAKIEFSKLHAPVEKPYHGQHGYESEIWPVRRDLFVTEQELKHEFKVTDSMEEIRLRYGDTMMEAYHTALRLNRRLIVAVLIFMIVAAFGIGVALYLGGVESNPFSWVASAVTGVAASIAATLLVDFRRKK